MVERRHALAQLCETRLLNAFVQLGKQSRLSLCENCALS
jgi:hypothetical protein